jgi:hypothetical protein
MRGVVSTEIRRLPFGEVTEKDWAGRAIGARARKRRCFMIWTVFIFWCVK